MVNPALSRAMFKVRNARALEAPGAPITDYQSLITALNRRRVELGLSMADLDGVTGLADGYSSKIFVGIRSIGKLSFGEVLQALKCELVLRPIEDDSAPHR